MLAPSTETSPPVIRYDGVDVYRPRLDFEIASCSISAQALGQFRHLLEWADVVHYHFPWPFADILQLALNHAGKASIVTYHSDIVRQKWLGKLYFPLMKRFLGSVNRIVCTSPNYFATSDVLSQFEGKVDIIPIGINEETYPDITHDELDEVRAKYGEDFFLFIGVLRYYKGLHILLDAIQEAPYKVIIVGSGPTELELKKQAEALGLTNLVFTGFVDNRLKMSLVHLSKAIVFPSYMRSEAFGVTLLEGAMCAKPLISTEVGSGTSHVNVDGETGLVVTPGSARELRKAMDQLHHRPDMARLMGKRARERYERLFTGKLMGNRYAALYKQFEDNDNDALPNEVAAEQR